MAKINVLESNVYNRIAAGEVVDRPYSVVKEFIENSIDAGAKKISVTIERGGKDLISVSDDGDGIERSELPVAFLPHATSKIACADDLDSISTLGFRGEALASIASVAKVTLRSKAKGASGAYEVSCAGGVLSEVTPCALGSGTEITAENLFYNTPVRAKFMRTDKGEEGEITNFIQRFILGNPEIAFTYTVDGKLSLQSYGGGLDEAVAAVYGAAVIGNCYKIDAVKHGIRVRGYVGRPDFTKANRTYQSTFVNGRYVTNNTVSSAISNAYASYLMKRQYPFYILFIDVPTEIVDVNVHPNKADVRFENNQVVYGCIYSILSSVLDGNASALDFVVGIKSTDIDTEKNMRRESENAPVSDNQNLNSGNEHFAGGGSGQFKTLRDAAQKSGYTAAAGNAAPEQRDVPPAAPVYPDKKDAEAAACFQPKREEKGWSLPRRPETGGGIRIEFHDVASGYVNGSPLNNENGESDIFAENKRYLEELEKKKAQQKFIFESAVYRGCLFNTYLMYETGDNVFMIDQHAAHERLIFDKLKEEMEHRTVLRQPMLVPYVLKLNAEEFSFLAEHLHAIEEMGFEIEEFGVGSFKISAVPLDLQDIDLNGFFADLLKDVGSLRSIRLSELLRDKIAMAACKHAVKGGMQLTESEKDKLFAMLRGDMALKCPHGRPIAVKLTKTEIEKMFKRIV